MSEPIPTSIPLTGPVPEGPARRYDFDHIPQLGPAKSGDRRGSLLPLEGGRPGLTYAQIPLQYVRHAEMAGWLKLFDSRRYTIVGPKGSIDMELMARGRVIPGVSGLSSKRVCLGPTKLICEATGLDPRTGFAPEPGAEPIPTEDPSDGPQEANSGLEAGREPGDPEPEDPASEGTRSGVDERAGSRQGKRYSRRS